MTAATRNAARTDTNQSAIVKLMRQVGLSVFNSKIPLDLQVSRHFVTVQIDIKNPTKSPSKRQLTENQKKFYREHHNHFLICVIETEEDVIALNGAMIHGLKSTHAYCVANMANHFATCYRKRK